MERANGTWRGVTGESDAVKVLSLHPMSDRVISDHPRAFNLWGGLRTVGVGVTDATAGPALPGIRSKASRKSPTTTRPRLQAMAD
jgi:hypothetical protein